MSQTQLIPGEEPHAAAKRAWGGWLTVDEVERLLVLIRLNVGGVEQFVWSAIVAKLETIQADAAPRRVTPPLRMTDSEVVDHDTLVTGARQQIARVQQQFPRPA